MRVVRHDRHYCARNADHLADNSLLSLVFAKVVCTVGTTPTNTRLGVPPDGGELHDMMLRHAGDTPPEGFV